METIKRLEELVEEISSCYDTIPEDIYNELNQLTGNDWKPEEYIEYCAEYWSSGSLEETVYALMHNGDYPDNQYVTIYVWKQNAHIEDNDKDTMLLVRSGNISDEKKNCLEKINMDDMVQWLLVYFQTWNIEKKGEYKYDFNYNGELDYAIYKYVLFAMKNEYMISLSYTNLSETELNGILEYIKAEGLCHYIC